MREEVLSIFSMLQLHNMLCTLMMIFIQAIQALAAALQFRTLESIYPENLA
jgi:hypothetical protein